MDRVPGHKSGLKIVAASLRMGMASIADLGVLSRKINLRVSGQGLGFRVSGFSFRFSGGVEVLVFRFQGSRVRG